MKHLGVRRGGIKCNACSPALGRQRRHTTGWRWLRWRRSDLKRELDIGGNGAPGHQAEILEHHAGVLARLEHRSAVDGNRALIGPNQARYNAQERGLPAAARAEQGDELSLATLALTRSSATIMSACKSRPLKNLLTLLNSTIGRAASAKRAVAGPSAFIWCEWPMSFNAATWQDCSSSAGDLISPRRAS